jgi:hypothetical protein
VLALAHTLTLLLSTQSRQGQYQFDEEISQHLNTCSPRLRKLVEEDIEYKLALSQKDFAGALQRVYAMVNGAAETPAQAGRIRKKNAKKEAFLKKINEYL